MREFYTFVSSRMWGTYFSPGPFPLSGSDLRFKLGYCASQWQQRKTLDWKQKNASFILTSLFQDVSQQWKNAYFHYFEQDSQGSSAHVVTFKGRSICLNPSVLKAVLCGAVEWFPECAEAGLGSTETVAVGL